MLNAIVGIIVMILFSSILALVYFLTGKLISFLFDLFEDPVTGKKSQTTASQDIYVGAVFIGVIYIIYLLTVWCFIPVGKLVISFL